MVIEPSPMQENVGPQHENGGLRKIKDCLKLRRVGNFTPNFHCA